MSASLLLSVKISIPPLSSICIINEVPDRGNPETTTGGNALKFYASQRLDIRKTGSGIKDKDGNVIGNHVKVKVVKNKVAPPFRIATFDIMFGKGISHTGDLLDLAVNKNIVAKTGAWFSYKDERLSFEE